MNTYKNIWIINEYAGSPYHGMEFRHFYLSKELQKLGYHITIISASYSHLFKKFPTVSQKFTFEKIEDIQYLWLKVPSYPQSHSKKRVLKWLAYTYALFHLPIKQLPVPDFIILSPMQTLPIFPALKWTKKFNSKLIFEVKDIWPLSIIELSSYSHSHPFIQLLKYTEKLAIQKSNAIVSVLPNYHLYLQDHGLNKKFHYIPNGINLSELQQIEPLNPDIEKTIPENKFIVAYTGTLGVANAMHYFIEAANILKDNHHICFLIVGDGSEKEKLKQQAESLKNVLFLPSIPKKQIHSLLQKCDACYIGLEKKEIFKYGVSPNKLFDYMYAAKPIIFSIHSPNNVVTLSQCGITTESPSPSLIANAILQLYNMSKEKRIELGHNGKIFVLNHHTYEALAQKYHLLLHSLQ